jgi:hypothetical protein
MLAFFSSHRNFHNQPCPEARQACARSGSHSVPPKSPKNIIRGEFRHVEALLPQKWHVPNTNFSPERKGSTSRPQHPISTQEQHRRGSGSEPPHYVESKECTGETALIQVIPPQLSRHTSSYITKCRRTIDSIPTDRIKYDT